MRIDRVDVDLFNVPPHREMHDAIQAVAGVQLIVVRVHTADGASGLGYSYTIGRGGSGVAAFVRDDLVPLLLGQDALQTVGLWERLWWGTNAVGRGGLGAVGRAACDIALWDLKARVANMPLATLLGGARQRLPVYNTDIGWLNIPIEEVVDGARAAIAAGFRGVKVKVGKPSANEDVARLAAVRAAIGPDIALMIDANQSFTAPEAIDRGRRFEEFDLVWFEEPLPAEDVGGYAQLRAALRTPIATGETLYSAASFKEYTDRNAVSILQPDVGRVGGITEWMRVASLAVVHNLQVAPHFLMEIHAHLTAAIPNTLWVEYIPVLDSVLAAPWPVVDGHISLPTSPGHGIEFNWERLNRYRVG